MLKTRGCPKRCDTAIFAFGVEDFSFCKSYCDLVSVGHESGQESVIVFYIIRNYGEAFSTFKDNTGILFNLEEGYFFTKKWIDFFR